MSNKESNEKKKGMPKFVYTILMLVFAGIACYCIYYLADYYLENKKSEDKYDELRNLIIEDNTGEPAYDDEGNEVPAFVEVDGKKIQAKYLNLYNRNNSFVAWIKIEGTGIDYPVVQTPEDEEYYLRRDFDGNKSTAGTVFVDTSSDIEKPSDNILIYGHNMKAGTMFHDLLEYDDEDYYKEHKYIEFNTIYGDGTYEIIAAFRTNIKAADDDGFKYYQFFDAENEEEFNYFIDNVKALTPYEIPVTAEYGDKLITLSTCSYHTDEGRFVIVAKKIE